MSGIHEPKRHDFIKHINTTTPPNCPVCQSSVKHGVRKCPDCDMIVHKKCQKKAPPCRQRKSLPPGSWNLANSPSSLTNRNRRTTLTFGKGKALSASTSCIQASENNLSGSSSSYPRYVGSNRSSINASPEGLDRSISIRGKSPSLPEVSKESVIWSNLILQSKRIVLRSDYSSTHLATYEAQSQELLEKRKKFIAKRNELILNHQKIEEEFEKELELSVAESANIFEATENLLDKTITAANTLGTWVESESNNAGVTSGATLANIATKLEATVEVAEVLRMDHKKLQDEVRLIELANKEMERNIKEFTKRKGEITAITNSKKDMVVKIQDLKSLVERLEKALASVTSGPTSPTGLNEPEDFKEIVDKVQETNTGIIKWVKEKIPDIEDEGIVYISKKGDPSSDTKDLPDLKFNEPGTEPGAGGPLSSEGTSEAQQQPGTSIPSVRAGTVNRLIERLAYDTYSDVNYQRSFLLTYRAFMAPRTLLEKLTLRYTSTPAPTITAESVVDLNKACQHVIQLRVLTVLKYWVDRYWHDFDELCSGKEGTECKSLLYEFLDTVVVNVSEKNTQIINSIKSTLEKRLAGIVPLQRSLSSTTPLVNSDSGFKVDSPNQISYLMHYDPKTIAQQQTLIEFELYANLQPKEFFKLAWSKDSKEEKAPNILKMIRRFNLVSNWVCAELVLTTDFVTRIEKMKKIILIAHELLKLNNFNGALSVVAGLGNSAVHRLRRTWEEVNKIDNGIYQKMFVEVNDLMENNYSKFRKALREARPPCIPYLGVFLTDLTFMEDGNPDKVENGLINFNKLRIIAEKIMEINQYQLELYTAIKPDPKIQDYLRGLKEVDDNEIYEMSLRVETRKMQKFFG